MCLKLKKLDSCFDELFTSWEANLDESIAKLLTVLRECLRLRCKPSEQQLITKFLAALQD